MGCYIDYLCMLYSVMVAYHPLASASPTCHCGERTPVSIKFHIIISAILCVLQDKNWTFYSRLLDGDPECMGTQRLL